MAKSENGEASTPEVAHSPQCRRCGASLVRLDGVEQCRDCGWTPPQGAD